MFHLSLKGNITIFLLVGFLSLLGLGCKRNTNAVNRPFAVGTKVYGLGFVEFTQDSILERPGPLAFWTMKTKGDSQSGEGSPPLMASDKEAFWAQLRQEAQTSGRLTIFVHGYDTRLQTAADRAKNLDDRGPVLLFKWANPVLHHNWIARYKLTSWWYASDTYDQHAKIASEVTTSFSKVLDEIGTRFQGIPVHLVGHSHGTRLLISAFSHSTLKADRMALIEGDTPAEEFEGKDGKAAQWLRSGRLKKVVNYASTGDPTMGVSRMHNHQIILGSLHRSVNPPLKSPANYNPTDIGSWPYLPVDIGCWKGHVLRDDSFYGHSEFFYSEQLIAHFRYRVLGLPADQTLGKRIREEVWPQNDMEHFPTIKSASGPSDALIIRIREVECPCDKEKLGAFGN
ncbi:MAG: alpha/beta hydrolase [Holophagaceae bacterium]|nr:alpha/beta hydrolase [Holophagaceae bacterium]